MDREPIEKLADRIYSVFTAFFHPVAVSVGQGDLGGLGSCIKAISVIDGNIRHGIPVDADDADFFFVRVEYGEEQRIRLPAFVEVFRGFHFPGLVDPHEKEGHDIVFISIDLSMIAEFPGLKGFFALCVRRKVL